MSTLFSETYFRIRRLTHMVRSTTSIFFLFIITIICLLGVCLSNVASGKEEDLAKYRENLLQTQDYEVASGKVILNVYASVEELTSLAPFVLSVELDFPVDFSPSPNDIPDVYGDFCFELLEDSLEKVSPTTNRLIRRWNVYPQQTGKQTIPPIPIYLSKVNDKDEILVNIQSATFIIPEIDASKANIETIEYDRSLIQPYPTLLLIFFVLCVLIAILFFKLRKKNLCVANQLEAQQEDPYVKALRMLEELKNSHAYLENRNCFYSDVSAILRVYLAERFEIKTEEKTTKEIIESINQLSVYTSEKEFYIQKERLIENAICQDSDPLTDEFKETEKQEQARVETLARLRKISICNTLQNEEVKQIIKQTLDFVDLVKFANYKTTFNDACNVYNSTQKVIIMAENTLNALISLYSRQELEQSQEPST